jgi:hypothetical protein
MSKMKPHKISSAMNNVEFDRNINFERSLARKHIAQWERENYALDPVYKDKMVNEMTKEQLLAKLAELSEWHKVGGVVEVGGDD